MQRASEEKDGQPSQAPCFDEIVDRHAERLYRVAYRLTGRADVAEDLVQESFLDALRGLSQLRSADSAFAWLVSILRRRRVKWLKDMLREPVSMPSIDVSAPIQ